MISSDDIGKKVFSKFWGLGVIVSVTVDDTDYAVGVMFQKIKWPFAHAPVKTMGDVYFNKEGICCMYEDSAEYNIQLERRGTYEP